MALKDRTVPMRTADIPPGTCVRGYADGKEIAIFNVDGQFYATQAECTHAGGPLCDGSLELDVVICPWHGSRFNVRTGEVVQDPATESLATYPVKVENGHLTVG